MEKPLLMKTYIEMIVGRATAEEHRYLKTMPSKDFSEYTKWKAEWLSLGATANSKTSIPALSGTTKSMLRSIFGITPSS
jgi:hypothetical protein